MQHSHNSTYRRAGKFRGRKFHAIKFRGRKFRDFVRKQAFRGFNFAISALTFRVYMRLGIYTSSDSTDRGVFAREQRLRLKAA